MRFKRADLPGIAIALLAPPALFLLFLASFETWNHRGTPLLGFTSSTIAIAVGVAAVFSRFVRHWELPLVLLFVLIGVVLAVNVVQRSDYDGTALATLLKWIGLADFALLNAVVGYEVFANGLLPAMDRRATRRVAEAASAAEATAIEAAAADAAEQ